MEDPHPSVVLFGKTKDSVSGGQVNYAVVATALVPAFDEEHQPSLQEPQVEAPDLGEGLEEQEFCLEGGRFWISSRRSRSHTC